MQCIVVTIVSLCCFTLFGCPADEAPPASKSLRPIAEGRRAAQMLKDRGMRLEKSSVMIVPFIPRWPMTGGERNIAFYAAGLKAADVDVTIFVPPSELKSMYESQGIDTQAVPNIFVDIDKMAEFKQIAEQLHALVTAEVQRLADASVMQRRADFVGAVEHLMAHLERLTRDTAGVVGLRMDPRTDAEHLAVRAVRFRKVVQARDIDVCITDFTPDALAATVGLLGTKRRSLWYAQLTLHEEVDDFVAVYGAVATCGQGVREERFAFAKHPGVYVVPNGTNLQRFCPASNSTLRPADMPHAGLAIGNVAHLSERKNQKMLVEACGRRTAELGDFQIYLFGNREAEDHGAYAREVEQVAERYGIEDRLHFMGDRTNVEDYLRHLDIFVFPSRAEGLSLAVVEALASGVPTLVSDIPGNRELQGAGMRLFPKSDVDALAAQLVHLAHDHGDRQHMAQGARRQMERGGYSISCMIFNMGQVLQHVMQ